MFDVLQINISWLRCWNVERICFCSLCTITCLLGVCWQGNDEAILKDPSKSSPVNKKINLWPKDRYLGYMKSNVWKQETSLLFFPSKRLILSPSFFMVSIFEATSIQINCHYPAFEVREWWPKSLTPFFFSFFLLFSLSFLPLSSVSFSVPQGKVWNGT